VFIEWLKKGGHGILNIDEKPEKKKKTLEVRF
jgi:hypothetical protein